MLWLTSDLPPCGVPGWRLGEAIELFVGALEHFATKDDRVGSVGATGTGRFGAFQGDGCGWWQVRLVDDLWMMGGQEATRNHCGWFLGLDAVILCVFEYESGTNLRWDDG